MRVTIEVMLIWGNKAVITRPGAALIELIHRLAASGFNLKGIVASWLESGRIA